MTQDEIIRMAGHRTVSPWVMKLVLEAVEAERELCAQVCLETDVHPDHGEVAGDFLAGHIWGCEDCAAAIRARGEK